MVENIVKIEKLDLKLDETGKASLEFLQLIIGKPLAAGSDLITDQIRFWQWQNRLRILEKAQNRLKEKGLSAKELPPDFVMPFLRDCSDVSNEILQDIWASLLAGTIQDKKKLHVAFVHVLKELSPIDVQILKHYIECGPYDKQEEKVTAITAALSITELQVRISFANLRRLGIFNATTGKRFTAFGIELVRICISDEVLIEKYLKREGNLPKGRFLWG